MMTDRYISFRIIALAVMLTVAGFVFSACVKEEFDAKIVEEGKPVEVTMTFSAKDVEELVVTKSNSYSRLTSLILFIFNSDGSKCEQIVETADGSLVLGGGSTGNGGITYTATFTTTTGNKLICALGNYISDNNWQHYDMTGVGTDEFDPDEPGRWKSFSEYVNELKKGAEAGKSAEELGKSLFFLQRVFSQDGNTPTFDEQQMIMTGADQVTIEKDNPTGNLYLQRCIADIQFNIGQEYTNTDGHTISFNASNYYVYNIPAGTRLSPNRGIETSPNESYREFYYDGTRKPIGSAEGGSFSFRFFIPENIQDSRNDVCSDYSSREKWDSNTTDEAKPTHKAWTNAPVNATYVVIEGQYSELDANSNLVYAGTVSYTIHLGNFGAGNWGDFTVLRNHRYIYNVSVHGIENIQVEATTDVENQPGAEGSIVSTSGTTRNYALDAHFEQVFLEYDLSAIAEAAKATQNSNSGMSDADAISEHLIVTIETPFQNGLRELHPYRTFVKNYSGGDYAQALEAARSADLADVDYKWVEFLPQKTDASDLQSYPGLPSWKSADGKTDSKLLDVYDACVKMGQVVAKIMNGETVDTGNSAESTEDGRGISVFSRTGSDGQAHYYATFTGFVDEYYYTADPLSGNDITWGTFVNTEQRRMLISMDVQTSSDGNSSLSNVHTNISQRSMQTFYNTAASGINAFGLETFNETPLCLYGDPKSSYDYYSSDTDGRSNQWAMIGSGSAYYGWNYYIDAAENGYKDNVTGARKLTDMYRDNVARAYYACMSRNRDLDGDGIIDKSEVHWYLPAINEYLRIGMGSIATSNESNLYVGDKSAMRRGDDTNGDGWPDNDNWYPDNYYAEGALYHTSTHGKQTFWAVEKGAYGGVTNGDLPIRCIRSLPADVNTGYAVADPMFDLYTIPNGNYLLDFRDKFDNNMYRPTRTDAQLNEHDEDDLQNRFYKGLVVSKKAQTETARLDEVLNIGSNKPNPCADYYEGSRNDPVNGQGHWRVPNLAELTILASNAEVLLNGSLSQYPIYCSTRFSNEKVRIAFRYDWTQISCLGDAGEKVDDDIYVYYRCVRDATDQDFAEATPAN